MTEFISCFVVVRHTKNGYITWRSPNYKPYARTATDKDTKRWKTIAGAARWLHNRHIEYASMCSIEEVAVGPDGFAVIIRDK